MHVSKENRDLDSVKKVRVYASLEEHIGWKINLFKDIHISEDEVYLKVGDVIYLQFSEKDVYIKVDLKNKAAKEIARYTSDMRHAKGEEQNLMDMEGGKGQKDSLDMIFEKITDGANVCFETSDYDTLGGGMKVMGSEGFWKIEGRNPIAGGIVSWGNYFYRFRHLITGKYLAFDNHGQMKLTNERGANSQFRFHQ